MALIYADRIKEATTVTGTSTIVLEGAVAGYKAFSAAMTNNDTCYYSLVDPNTDEWEIGLGTFATGNLLQRTTVISSSNSNNAVTFGTGTKDVFITLPAEGIDAKAPISAPAFTGSVTLSGASSRLVGDLSSASPATRLCAQSSTVDGQTIFSVIPNGTSRLSGVSCHNASDANNSSNLELLITSTDSMIVSGEYGTGSYLPLTVFVDNAAAMVVTASGTGAAGGDPRVLINKSALDGTGSHLQVAGGVSSDAIILSNQIAPASEADTGTAGEIRFDSNYLYRCVSTNVWKRLPLLDTFSSVLSTSDTGTDSIDLTGMSDATPKTIRYSKHGNMVFITFPASCTATSNSTNFSITGLAAALIPSVSVSAPAVVVNNNTYELGWITIGTNGSATITRQTSAWSNTGVKGIGACTISYEV